MCIRQAHDRLFSIQEFLKAAIFYFVMIVINECFLFSSLLSLLLECYYFIYLFFLTKSFRLVSNRVFLSMVHYWGLLYILFNPLSLENDHYRVKRACPLYRRNIPYLFGSKCWETNLNYKCVLKIGIIFAISLARERQLPNQRKSQRLLQLLWSQVKRKF